MPNDNTDIIPLKIDLDKILRGAGTPEEMKIFNAFLHENEKKDQPQSLFLGGGIDVYIVDEFPDIKKNSYYNNSYVFNKESELSLSYISAKGEITPIKLADLLKASISSKIKDLDIDPHKPVLDQLNANRNANTLRVRDTIQETIPSSIQPTYPFSYENKTYAIKFNENIVRYLSRPSGRNTPLAERTKPIIHGKPKYHYEIFSSTPFYSTNIRGLHSSLGAVKLSEEKNLTKSTIESYATSNKNQRVIKIESIDDPIAAEAVYNERLEQYKFLIGTPLGLGLKQPELTQTHDGFVIVNTMAFIEGVTLDNLSKKSPEQFQTERFEIMEQAFENLYSHFHKKGWLHRDVKLSNFITNIADNTTQIIDFDDAIPLEKTQKGKIAGTEAYFAPELYKKDAENTLASDIFAMGLAALSLYKGGASVNNKNLEKELAKVPNGDFKNLMEIMLNADPNKRKTMLYALTTLQKIKPALEKEAMLEKLQNSNYEGSMQKIMTKLEISPNKPNSPTIEKINSKEKADPTAPQKDTVVIENLVSPAPSTPVTFKR